MTETTRSRGRGERGIAIIVTALCLIPLMTFAAFGVDLASWYSRSSFLQKSADAAALAGTVWMPNLPKATTVACDSLKQNGIDGGACGAGDFQVQIERGTTSSTSLRVAVTDPNATRYFSQVVSSGQQRLTRSAEAEYNLPIPLGSPLNYFGGDASKTSVPDTFEYSVDWPVPYDAARPPAIAQVGETQQSFSCHVGGSAAEAFGGWSNATTYNAGLTGTNRCFYSARFTTASGTTMVPPPDHTRRVPNTVPCRVRANGTSNGTVVGSWSGTTYTAGNSGSGNPCVWPNVVSAALPPVAYYTGASGTPPVNRPCNVGYAASLGSWSTSAYQPTTFFTAASTAGNRLCRWPALIRTTVISTPNPISSTRSPGFWAQIHGPGGDQQSGDAYSTRCLTTTNCATPNNDLYTDPSDPNQGYWYVVKIPVGGAGPTVLRVFDAQLTPGNLDVGAGDSTISGSSMSFNTTYRVFRQTNPLDFNARTPINLGGANQTPGSCNWSVQQQAEFRFSWVDLCTVNASEGDTYLINVRTSTIGGVSNSAGRNGYALEACRAASCTVGVQPALYARERMVLYNNITSGDSTFYIAEVGPQYAGRTLVLELFDPGESSGTAWLYPRRPSTTAPGAVTPVPAADCDFSSTRSGYPRASDLNNGGVCSVRTADGSGLYNGHWLTIRIAIPPTYACTPGLNPVTSPNSCWWGMRYAFGGSATDTTTWQARIEGNPVHLTL